MLCGRMASGGGFFCWSHIRSVGKRCYCQRRRRSHLRPSSRELMQPTRDSLIIRETIDWLQFPHAYHHPDRKFTYRWHSNLALEPSSDSVVDTLRLPPARVDTHIGVALVAVEALGACQSFRPSTLQILTIHDLCERLRPHNSLRGYSFILKDLREELRFNVRFFTILMCFFAATI